MLYQYHELTRSLLNPVFRLAGLSSPVLRHPLSPLAHLPFSQRAAALGELIYRLAKDYEKPAFGIDSVQVQGKAVAVEEELVEERPFCRLLHFRKQLPAGAGATKQAVVLPVVLLVAPLSGHHATLLRDTVNSLLPQHDVHITDWVDARMVPLSQGPFHLHDYVHYVRDFIRLLGPDVHVVSVCQPTVPVLAAISLMASSDDARRPKSMVMMGGPIDPRRSPTQVNGLATGKSYSWFDNNLIHPVPANYPGFGRKVYPGFLQHAGFMAMNPGRHLRSHWDFYQHLRRGDNASAEEHRKFYDEYNAVLDMPAEYYLDTIRIVFQEFHLPLGTWEVEGEPVRPQDIRDVALFTVEGELDDISGPGQTRAAHDLCTALPESMRKHYTAPGCGHYGIFSGRRWRDDICPRIARFIRSRT